MPIDEVGIHPNASFRGHIVMNEVCMKYKKNEFFAANAIARSAFELRDKYPGGARLAWGVAMIKLREATGYEVKHEG